MNGPHSPPYFVQIIVSVLLVRLSVASCPQQCDCSAKQNTTKMTCKRGPLLSVPQDVPETQIIVIDGDGRTDINIQDIGENAFTPYVKLEELTIANAGVRFIHPRAFIGLSRLLRLDLHNNKIEYLDDKIFSDMKFLVILDLSHNRIRRVYREMFAFPYLQVLSLKDNGADLRDRYLFQKLSRVDLLDVSGNDVGSELPAAFYGVNTKLRTLRMNSCGIREVGPEFVKMVELVHSIELKDNSISDIPAKTFSSLKKLEEIYLDNNNLHTLDSALLQRLELRVLGLGGNNISVLKTDTFHNTSIRHIVMSRNSITRIPTGFFSPIRGLQKIQLDGNPLNYIGAETFAGLDGLDFLDLSNSQLHGFSLEAFSDISIRFLDLSKNSLMTITENALRQFEKVDLVDFSGNPWHCTCFIKPLKKWLKDSSYGQNCSIKLDPKTTLTDREKRPFTNCLTCTTPSINENATLSELTPQRLEQCYYLKKGELTLDQKVLICVAVTLCVIFIVFVAYHLFQRRNILKYTLKGRSDVIANHGVGTLPGSRVASKADLTDSVATEPTCLDSTVKLQNISSISRPRSFDPEAENIMNGLIYKSQLPEKTKEVNGNDGYVASLESCV